MTKKVTIQIDPKLWGLAHQAKLDLGKELGEMTQEALIEHLKKLGYGKELRRLGYK